jgi:hypothetical protein
MDATREGARPKGPPAGRPTSITSRPDTLLRQPGIRVSGRWFIVGSRRYDVTELSHLRTVRGPRDPLTIRAVITTGVVLAAIGRLRPRPFELWAEYRGMTVQLFYSDSEREYGQVCRALVRAREMARLGPAGDPWPSLDPWGSIPR